MAVTQQLNDSDQALAERCSRGDEAAFNILVERYERPVLNFVYRMIGDAAAAEDLAQEVFVRVWRGIGAYRPRPGAAFSTWLFQIARNVTLDYQRRLNRRPIGHLLSDAAAFFNKALVDNSTDRDVAAREIGERVSSAVQKLSEKQRAAVVLSVYEGMSDREVAAVMRCSVKSVETRLYRARKKLRRTLREFLE